MWRPQIHEVIKLLLAVIVVGVFLLLYIKGRDFPIQIVPWLERTEDQKTLLFTRAKPTRESIFTRAKPITTTTEIVPMSTTLSLSVSSTERMSVFPYISSQPFLLSNNSICRLIPNLALMILIHSAPNHFKYRNAIRNSWAKYSNYHQNASFRIVFLLGKVSTEVQGRLAREHKIHGDILQGNFIDGYSNLTLNTLYGLYWVNAYCRNAKVIMKIDDDVAVDLYSIFPLVIFRYIRVNKHVYCNQLYNSPIARNIESKLFVDENIFRGQRYFPPYCDGKAVILTSDLVYPLLQKAAYTPIFWIEDVYVYGLVLNQIPKVMYDNYRWGYEFTLDCDYDTSCVTNETTCRTMFAELKQNIVPQIKNSWKVFQQRQHVCSTQ